MKNVKRFLLGVVFATLVFATCGMSVMAADTTKTLKQNVWFTQKSSEGYVYNKITIPNDGYITVTVEKSNKADYAWIDLYDSKKSYAGDILYNSDDKKVVANYPVRKGTYYLKGSAYNNYKYKWKFTKAVNKNNYCASKAISLNANKEVVVVNTVKDAYDRWYKIKLTKKKSIDFWLTRAGGSGYVYLYDDEMEQLDTVYDDDDDCYYTRNKLAKGTYYVRLVPAHYYNNKNNKANLISFKWK